jgi:hypothetical protein
MEIGSRSDKVMPEAMFKTIKRNDHRKMGKALPATTGSFCRLYMI